MLNLVSGNLVSPGVSVEHHWQSCRGPLGHWHLITWTCCRGLLTSVSPSACLQCSWPYSPGAADHKYSSHPSAAYPSRKRQLPTVNFKHFCCVFFFQWASSLGIFAFEHFFYFLLPYLTLFDCLWCSFPLSDRQWMLFTVTFLPYQSFLYYYTHW